MDSRSSPAPARSAVSTWADVTSASTMSATSWRAAGIVPTVVGRTRPESGSALRPTAKATERSGNPYFATMRGWSSPACATALPSIMSSAQRPGCHGAKSERFTVH